MDFFFQPRGVAVIGASPDPGKGGNIIVSNLQKGYRGGIYPVNPRYQDINGLKCYPAVEDVPDPVDLAIVYVGASIVPRIIRDCARRGIAGAMLESAGFSETGPEGAALQEETARIAGRTGIRLWGPNCMGLVDAVNRRVFSTVTPSIWDVGLTPGRVSFIVQSGMLAGAFLIDVMSHGTTGISKACSIGNKMDIDESDLLDYLLDDPDTGAVGLYLESINDGRRFAALCRRATKPIVVLRGGKSEKGAQAALSHTASLAGNGAVIRGALRQAGVVEADDFFQMMDLCRVLATYPRQPDEPGNRIAIMTYSGGAGIVSTDFLGPLGLSLAELAPSTLEMLQQVYPAWMKPANPMDLWPGIIGNGAVKTFNHAVRAACSDPGVDGLLVHCFVGGFSLEPDLRTMAELARKAGKPLVCWISGARQAVHAFQVEALALDIPVFREVYRAVECLAAVLKRPSKRKAQAAEPVSVSVPAGLLDIQTENRGDLDEHRSKQVLAAIGIPVVPEQTAASPEQAVETARRLGFPVVLKGIAPGVIHKAETGLVHLNISSERQVESAFADLNAAMQGQGTILVQSHLSGKLEIIVGLVRDPQFGPCVMCGLGGILTELLDDTVFAPAPLSRLDALDLIARLKNQKWLDGLRGAEPLDRPALADVLVRIGALGAAYPQISEIDVNPMLVTKGRPVAVDATIILNPRE